METEPGGLSIIPYRVAELKDNKTLSVIMSSQASI